MPQTGPIDIFRDDVVHLRKPHPCGSHEWTVVRLGADIGLRCHGCDHKVLLPRRTLEKRLKRFVSRGPAYAEAVALRERLDSAADATLGPETPPESDSDSASPALVGAAGSSPRGAD